jgi:hypothetical protein
MSGEAIGKDSYPPMPTQKSLEESCNSDKREGRKVGMLRVAQQGLKINN